MKQKIIIGIACDGFRLTQVDEADNVVQSCFIDQEELTDSAIGPFFKSLGFDVEIQEEY
jgi:hypothetical protein